MNVFIVVVNVILVALTLGVIYFAWQTVGQAKEAGVATWKAVAALTSLLTVTEKTTALMAQSAEAAHETVAIAKAARDQAEYDRKLRALMEVEELAERIYQQASIVVPASTPGWRCSLQNFLAMALRRVEISLPQSERLAGGMPTAAGVAAQARDAQQEAEAEVRHLMEQQPKP